MTVCSHRVKPPQHAISDGLVMLYAHDATASCPRGPGGPLNRRDDGWGIRRWIRLRAALEAVGPSSLNDSLLGRSSRLIESELLRVGHEKLLHQSSGITPPIFISQQVEPIFKPFRKEFRL